ncbi:hypothetical protein D3C76_1190880 [compost metagenome]
MIWPEIDARIGINTGVTRDILTEIAVTAAAHIETCIAIVITQLQTAAVFGDAAPAFAGVFVFQTHVGKQAVCHRAALAGHDQ